MMDENPIATLSKCVAHAVYEGFPEFEYQDRDWSMGYQPGVEPKYITKKRKHIDYEVGVYAMFPQTWGSTALGFGGVGGAWGSITNSGIMDNVITYRDSGFSAQASLMHVTTNITPGLVTKVNNIVGTWAESGYRYTEDRFGDIGVYAGIKPMVLSGDVEARMPTSVDNAGNVVYTNKKLAIQNQITPYVRALYTNMIDKKTMYRFSVMGTQQGQYRLMHELRFWIN